MNKYQVALNDFSKTIKVINGKPTIINNEYDASKFVLYESQIRILQELVDKTTPKKPIKLEITDLDEIIMPEYTNTIDKYMCDNCGLTWFIVDGHTYQHKYCKQCGQAIDWSNNED